MSRYLHDPQPHNLLLKHSPIVPAGCQPPDLQLGQRERVMEKPWNNLVLPVMGCHVPSIN